MTRQTVLVTGGAGFIGHYIIQVLLEKTNYNIISLDRLDFSGNLNRLAIIPSGQRHRVKIIHHDLRAELNQDLIRQIGEVNYVFHLAASSHVTRSISNPREFLENNVVGTFNLLEYARKLPNLRKFIYFSTDEVFGPSYGDLSFKPNDRYNSGNPYSASKAAGEEFCVAYKNTYNLPIIITHTMNVYGLRQNPEKFIPKIIKNIMSGKETEIHYDSKTGNTGSRNWLHAYDVGLALLFLMDISPSKEPLGFKYNIVSVDFMDNLQVFEHVKMWAKDYGTKKWNTNYKLVDPNNTDRPGHDFHYHIDGSKLHKLGWKQTFYAAREIPTIAWEYFTNRDNLQDWL